jgi:hypothetical protein
VKGEFLEVWVQVLVDTLSHPTVAIASHAVAIADFSELVAILSPDVVLGHSYNPACMIAVAVDAVTYIISYLVCDHCRSP